MIRPFATVHSRLTFCGHTSLSIRLQGPAVCPARAGPAYGTSGTTEARCRWRAKITGVRMIPRPSRRGLSRVPSWQVVRRSPDRPCATRGAVPPPEKGVHPAGSPYRRVRSSPDSGERVAPSRPACRPRLPTAGSTPFPARAHSAADGPRLVRALEPFPNVRRDSGPPPDFLVVPPTAGKPIESPHPPRADVLAVDEAPRGVPRLRVSGAEEGRAAGRPAAAARDGTLARRHAASPGAP